MLTAVAIHLYQSLSTVVMNAMIDNATYDSCEYGLSKKTKGLKFVSRTPVHR